MDLVLGGTHVLPVTTAGLQGEQPQLGGGGMCVSIVLGTHQIEQIPLGEGRLPGLTISRGNHGSES